VLPPAAAAAAAATFGLVVWMDGTYFWSNIFIYFKIN
jgi:hypothetical protein